MRCSFCKLERQHVAKLIAGPDVFICDGCVRISIEIVDRETNADDRVTAARWALLRELGSMPPRSPRAAVRKLVLAGIALSEGDPEALRQLAQHAWIAGDPEGGICALRRIAEHDRTTDDDITEAVHHDTNGAYEEGLALLDALDPATLAPSAREIVPLHRAVMRLAGELASADEARDLERIATTFEERLPELGLDNDYARGLLREATLVRARAAKLAGELVRAEAILREHLLVHETDPEAWSLLFELHHARGEHEHARIARNKALEHAHPEGPTALRLRDPSAGPFR